MPLIKNTAIDDDGVEREIVSRQDALARGLKFYFTGKACKYGHVAERYSHGHCVTCAKERARQWRKDNPERAKENSRQWRKDNPERAKENSRQWAKDNPEKVKEQALQWYKDNAERKKELQRQWREKHPENVRAISRRQRDLNQNIITNFTAEEERQKLSNQRNKCAICAKRFKLKRRCKCPSCNRIKDKTSLGKQVCYHTDHIFPIALARQTDFFKQEGYYEYFHSDLQLLCPQCNIEKSDLDAKKTHALFDTQLQQMLCLTLDTNAKPNLNSTNKI